MPELYDAIRSRRSIRKYKSDEIPQEKIMKVLDAANWAPSNGNSQSWKFTVTKGEAVKKVCNIFYNFAKDYILSAPYIPAEQKPGMIKYAENFGGAPMHIIVSYEVYENDAIKTEESLMGACAAIQNLMLAAWAEGLGTVWIAGQVTHDPETRKVLDLDDNYEIAGVIPIGYSDGQVPDSFRDDVKKKTCWIGF